MLGIFKQFNWVDVLVVILFFRICYIAVITGLPSEFFKLIGTICAIYLSLHYFTELSDFVMMHSSVHKVPLEFLDFLSFLTLAIMGYLIFALLRNIFSHFIKMEAAPKLNKLGGLILGVVRGFFCVGLIVFILAVSTVSYLKKSAEDSCYGKRLFKSTVDTYSWLWNTVTSKFMRGEKFNKTILEIQEYFL